MAPPPSGGNNVEYQYCDASQVPVFFAYQDGTGAWQALTGFTSGNTTRFAFNVTQGRGGVLAVFRTPGLTATDVLTVGRMTNARQVATRRARSGAALGMVATLRRSVVADVYRPRSLCDHRGAHAGRHRQLRTNPADEDSDGTVVGEGERYRDTLVSSTESFGTGVPATPTTVTFTDVPSVPSTSLGPACHSRTTVQLRRAGRSFPQPQRPGRRVPPIDNRFQRAGGNGACNSQRDHHRR